MIVLALLAAAVCVVRARTVLPQSQVDAFKDFLVLLNYGDEDVNTASQYLNSATCSDTVNYVYVHC